MDAEEKIIKDRFLEKDSKCEDVTFLEDQRGPRIAWIDVKNIDLNYCKSMQKKEDRTAAENDLKEKESERLRGSENVLPVEASKDINDEDTDDKEYEPAVKKKSRAVTLEVPRNIFSDPNVTAMLDRTKCNYWGCFFCFKGSWCRFE